MRKKEKFFSYGVIILTAAAIWLCCSLWLFGYRSEGSGGISLVVPVLVCTGIRWLHVDRCVVCTQGDLRASRGS